MTPNHNGSIETCNCAGCQQARGWIKRVLFLLAGLGLLALTLFTIWLLIVEIFSL